MAKKKKSPIFLIGIAVVLLVLVFSSKSLFKSKTATSGKSLGVFLAKGDEGKVEDSEDSEDIEDNEDNDEEASGDDDSSDSDNSGSSASKIIFINPTTGVKTEIEREENKDEIKMEIQSGDNKVKTETKKGKTKFEGRLAGMKVRFELEDGKLVMKQENEDEDETEEEQELDEDEAQEVEDELEEEDIKVSTEGGSLVVLRRGIGARTTLPISIDTSANALIVTTPAGTKVVTILPDAAINNLIDANVLSLILSRPAEAAELTEVEDHLVFKVEGIKKEKFLGLLSVSLRKKVVMNAQNAQVEQELESFLTRLLDILSV